MPVEVLYSIGCSIAVSFIYYKTCGGEGLFETKSSSRRFVMRQVLRISLCLGLLVGTISLATAAWSQEVAATLSGTVTDPSGAVVSGATVVVRGNDTNADFRTVTTNGSGGFTVTNMPAGRYAVTVKSPGFKSYVAQDVVLNVAEKHTLDVQLNAGQVTETVEVQAENTAIQTTTAEESGTVTGDQVRELALM